MTSLWLIQYLLGVFIAYYFMSLFTTHRLSDLVNRSVMWLVRLILGQRKTAERITHKQPVTSSPIIDKQPLVSELGSYIGGIPVSQEQLERWLQSNPNLKVSNKK
jgi:hypothetical protein